MPGVKNDSGLAQGILYFAGSPDPRADVRRSTALYLVVGADSLEGGTSPFNRMYVTMFP